MQFNAKFIEKTNHPDFEGERGQVSRSYRHDRDIVIDERRISDEGLVDLIAVAQETKDAKSRKALEAILELRRGTAEADAPVPSFAAFRPYLRDFLDRDAIDGWVYVTHADGSVYPELVTSVTYDDGHAQHGNSQPPSVTLHTVSHTLSRDGNYRTTFQSNKASYVFRGADVSRKSVRSALASKGIAKETAELKSAYVEAMKRHRDVVVDGFAEQFVFTGTVSRYESDRRRAQQSLAGRKVIHDTEHEEFGSLDTFDETETSAGKDGVAAVPVHAFVRVFDLTTQETYWVNSGGLEPYVYDRSMGEKLVLDDTHRKVLDALTKNWKLFTQDIITGKATGNCILCKGGPGLGKTLTAEVYAEIVGRPLLTIRSGSLGTNAEQIKSNLDVAFARATRWNAILMLNEVDVFVMRRGNDLHINSVVATFLEAIEYFEGLVFCSTNRPDDIDDAFVQRCLAIIEYRAPNAEQSAKTWRMLTDFFGVDLPESEIAVLVEAFPGIAPRDIKMLTAQTLRMLNGDRQPTAADFLEYAPFRGLKAKTRDAG